MTESRALARFVVHSSWPDLPAQVRHETTRALVNWIGNPIWGSANAAVERTLAALDPFSGPREAALIGRSERIDVFKAALINGIAANIADYDDTHLATVIHPTGPAACALLALVERRRVSGGEFLHALALGIEAQCRVAMALAAPPARANGAWYLTGITGGIGAAVAIGRLLGLDEDRMLWAIGIAAARAAGSRETHGTMAKNLVPACAAEAGIFAALLAQHDMMAPEAPIEGKRGLGCLVAEGADFTAITRGLGQRFELMGNAYKPFPSGIVTHAAITAALELARRERNLELAGNILDEMRENDDGFWGADFLDDATANRPVPAELLKQILEGERAEKQFPVYERSSPVQYSSKLRRRDCDCPDCRARRGETPSEWGEDDGEDQDQNEFAEPLPAAFSRALEQFEQFLDGLPPRIARKVEEAIARGEPPEIAVPRIFKNVPPEMRPPAPGGKTKKGTGTLPSPAQGNLF